MRHYPNNEINTVHGGEIHRLEKCEKDAILESGRASSGEAFSLWKVSRQDKLLLAALFLVDLSVYMSLSVMAPFFPQEVWSFLCWFYVLFCNVCVVEGKVLCRCCSALYCVIECTILL